MTPAMLREALAPLADEVAALRREVVTLRDRLGEATLSQKEVCSRFKVSTPTVARRRREGLLTNVGTANRPRYDVRQCERLFKR